MTRANRILACLVAATMAVPPWVAAQALTRIGAAGAVAGLVKAVSRGEAAVGHVVDSGKPLFLHDHVTSDARGRLQVMLLDQTVFTLGPNSDMVLDEFVYDPDTGAGKVSAQVTKGVFRFITGKVAQRNPSDMKVKLPSGLIGIRGTIAAGKVEGGDSLVVLLGPGSQNNADEKSGMVSVENGGSSVELKQPGYGTNVSGGNPPSPPFEVPAAQLNDILSALAPKAESGGQQGGGKASEDSGQDTAAGKGGASDAELSASEEAALDTLSTQATLDAANKGIQNGIASWEQVRTIESGTGLYSGSGSFTQFTTSSGSSCVGCTGTSSLTLNIDFGARTVGGGTSSLSFGPTSGVDPISGSTTVTTLNFSALSGNATITSSNMGSSTFSGSSINLKNKDGVVAKEAHASINYTNALQTGQGTVVGTR